MNAALFILSLWYVCECMYVGKGVFVCVLWKVPHNSVCIFCLLATPQGLMDNLQSWWQFCMIMGQTHTRTHKTHRQDQSPSLHYAIVLESHQTQENLIKTVASLSLSPSHSSVTFGFHTHRPVLIILKPGIKDGTAANQNHSIFKTS